MSDQLTEVRETDAPPEVSAIYSDTRRAVGIPLVNLIYRHLAALPGVLPCVWHIARQPIASGAIDAARTRLVAALEVPALDWLDRTSTGRAPLSETDIQVIDVVLKVYNRGNATNMIVLTAFRKLLDGTMPTVGPAAAPAFIPSHALSQRLQSRLCLESTSSQRRLRD